MYLKKEYIGTPQKQIIPMYPHIQSYQIKQPLELHPPTESIKRKDRDKYTEVPSEYSIYEYRLFLLYFITPADEKTHGFNRVDDSPQIF